MLGYWIVVSTQTPEERDAIIDRKKSVLAEWETGVSGIRWLEKLVEEGKATKLRGDGYPNRYTSTTDIVLPLITGDAIKPADDGIQQPQGKFMKKNIAILAALSVATLAACGSKTDANEKNFGAAMTQYFDKKGDLCLNTKRWPVDLSEMDLRLQKTMQAGSANQMAALEAAGLVKGEDTEVDIMGIMGKPTGAKAKIKRYTLTDAAKPFAQEKEVASIGLNGKTTEKQTDLCWGKKALDKIVKWEGPMKFGDYQEAGITYTYKVNNLADWAKKPEVQAAFPVVKSILDGAGSKESKHAIKLTSQGWEAKGLD